MILEEGVYAQLIGNSGVSAVVANRVYPLALPQKPAYPAIRFQRISSTPEHSHGGHSGVATTRVQFDCFDVTALGAKRLGELVRLALDSFQGTMGGDNGVEVDGCFIDDSRDEYDGEIPVYWTSLDFLIVHAEARA